MPKFQDKIAAIHFINKLAIDKKKFVVLIDFEIRECMVVEENDFEKENILFSSDIMKHIPDKSFGDGDLKLDSIIKNKEKHIDNIQHLINAIHNGESYLLNYCIATPIEINLSLEEIFYRTNAKYKIFYKDEWVCFSPESFIKIMDDKIYTFPMKGTIDASLPNAKTILLNDKKELAEHHTIVDLMRNDLSIVAKNICVEKFRYFSQVLSKTKTLWQTSSKIVGDVGNDWQSRLGNILFALLPAGSISGAPKKRTMELIKQYEMQRRGWFTGVAGFFDGKQFDSAVLIRWIEKEEGTKKHYYKSGSGITAQSNPENEFQECLDKIYVPII